MKKENSEIKITADYVVGKFPKLRRLTIHRDPLVDKGLLTSNDPDKLKEQIKTSDLDLLIDDLISIFYSQNMEKSKIKVIVFDIFMKIREYKNKDLSDITIDWVDISDPITGDVISTFPSKIRYSSNSMIEEETLF